MKRPLLVPIIFFLFGILIAGLINLPVLSGYIPAFITALVLAILLLVKTVKKEKYFFHFLCLFFFLLGSFRYTASVTPSKNDISRFILSTPREVILYGVVSNDPEWKGPPYAR
ncbi:MAG: DUF4131 domain-containing protein, partial [Candidatus Omnitrophota bacterium]